MSRAVAKKAAATGAATKRASTKRAIRAQRQRTPSRENVGPRGELKVALRLRPSTRHLAPYAAPEEGRLGKLRLDFNENTIGCSPAVLRALRGITREQLTLYPEYEASVRRLARSFGMRPAEMLLTNGVDDALRLLMETFVEPGSSVLVPEPTFSMYRFFSEIAGANVEVVRYDDAMRFPLEATLKALRRAPRILFLANPNNPTGTLLDHGALTRILDAAPRTLVLVDEAYFEFAGLTVLPWIRRRPNLVVARTFSKAAGLASLRLGALFATAKLADTMRRAFTPYPVNSAALVAAEAAMTDRRFLRRYVSEVRESRWLLARGLEQMGVRVFPSAANFLLVDFGPGAGRLVRKLAARGILVRDRASDFGRDGFVRITAGTTAQTRMVLRAIEREWA
jgi:histidinol-phosphate aminotransferase